MSKSFAETLYPRKLKSFGVGAQLFTVAGLFCIYSLLAYTEYQTTGKMWGYPLSISILFVPIYEELIFRVFILVGLMKFYSIRTSFIISCLLFGLWHLKNIFWLSTPDLLYQMAYATFIFGPIVAYLTLKTKNVWTAIIFHYLNNIIAPFSAAAIAFLAHKIF